MAQCVGGNLIYSPRQKDLKRYFVAGLVSEYFYYRHLLCLFVKSQVVGIGLFHPPYLKIISKIFKSTLLLKQATLINK